LNIMEIEQIGVAERRSSAGREGTGGGAETADRPI